MTSAVVKQLQSCDFLPQSENLCNDFCKKVGIKFAEKLLNSNNEPKKFLKKAKRLLNEKNSQNNGPEINEELEIEIIFSSISSDSKFLEIFDRLNSLIFDYRKVINENLYVSNSKGTQNPLLIKFSKDEKFFHEFLIQNKDNFDYNKILNSIDWEKLEIEIKSKLDHFSRLSLLQN